MKKMLSIILAIVMVCSLSVTAFAADITVSGDTEQAITATYTAAQDASSAGNIYSVKLTWTDVSVSYKGAVGATYKWDTTDLVYKLVENTGSEAEWTDKAITITVENRSNASITATASYEKAGDETLTFANDGKVTLTSAAVKDGSVIDFKDTTTVGTAQTGTITGTMGGKIEAAGELGTITISLTHD